MPKAVRKTKGSRGVNRSNPLSALATETGQEYGPSAAGMVWTRMSSLGHSSESGLSECMDMESSECPLDEKMNRAKVMDCTGETLLLQDQARLKRLASNIPVLVKVIAQPWEHGRGHQRNYDLSHSGTVPHENSNHQKTSSHLFQRADLLGEDSVHQRAYDNLFQNDGLLYDNPNLQTCSLQNGCQDVKATWAMPLTSEWGANVLCNTLPKKICHTTHISPRSESFTSNSTHYDPVDMETPLLSCKQKCLGEHFERGTNTLPELLKEHPSFLSSSSTIKHRAKSEVIMLDDMDDYPNIDMLEETSAVFHIKRRPEIPLKLLRESPFPGNSGIRGQTVVMNNKDKQQSLVILEETPTMIVSICKVHPTLIQVTRYAVHRQVSSCQQGQHSQSTDVSDIQHYKGSNFKDESSPSVAAPLQKTFVCLSDQTYNLVPGEGNYVIDTALPPLPLCNKKNCVQEENGNMQKCEDTLKLESFKVNGGPSLLSVSPPCTVPFTTINSNYNGDKEAMFLLRNSAFDSVTEMQEIKTKKTLNHRFPRHGQMPVKNLVNGSFVFSPNTKVLNRQDVTQPAQIQDARDAGCLVSSSKLVYNSFCIPQFYSGTVGAPTASMNTHVVWTSQSPRFSVPSIITPEREDSVCHMYLQSGDKCYNVTSLHCSNGIETILPHTGEVSESFYRDSSISSHMMDIYKNEVAHKTESYVIMPDNSARDSIWFSDGRDTHNTGISGGVLGAYSDNSNSNNCSPCCTTESHVQTCLEARPGCGKGECLVTPSTLSDLVIDSEEQDDTDTYSQSDPSYSTLPYYKLSGINENDVAENKSQGSALHISLEGEATHDTHANVSTKKSWLEDNMNASDFSDLLDSLLDDIESEKVVNCAAKVPHSSSSDTVEPTTSTTEETEDKHSEKSAEYILKDISRSGYNLDINKSECYSRPLLLQLFEKDVGKDVTFLVPVSGTSHLHETSHIAQQTSCMASSIDTKAKIPQTVSFRTVPSGSGYGIFHLATQSTQIKPTFVSSLRKGKRAETEREVFRSARGIAKTASNSGQRKAEECSEYPKSVMQPVSKIPAYSSVNENGKLTLPVGKTGISIDIPKYASVNVKSFLSTGSSSQNPPRTKSVSTKRWWPKLSSSSGVMVSSSLPTTAGSLQILPSQCKSKAQQRRKKLLLSQTVTTVVIASPQTDRKIQSSSMSPMLMAPLNESSVPCAVLQGDFTHTSSSTSVSGQGTLISKKTQRQFCPCGVAHPCISTSEMDKLSSHPNTSPSFCSLTSKEQPFMIQIKSCTRSSNDTSSSTREMRVCKHEDSNRAHEKMQRQILKRKSYPDSFESRKVLMDSLKQLLPECSESVLSMLHPPQKAIYRGYFSSKELQTLQTQAHGIHLSLLYRDHVSLCTQHHCPTCVSFRQRSALINGERELWGHSKENRGETAKKQPKGKKREGGWRSKTENEDDLYFMSSFSSHIKGELTKLKENQLGTYCKKAKGSSKKENITKSLFMLHRKTKAWKGDQIIKHSFSDSDLLHLTKEEAAEDTKHSCDDFCLIAHPVFQGPITTHGHRLSLVSQSSNSSQCHRLSSTPSKGKEFPFRREIIPKTKSHIYTLRNDHWASVCRTAAANLRLKKELEKGKGKTLKEKLM